MDTYIYIYTCIYVFVYIYAHIYIHIYICMFMSMYIYIWIYADAFTCGGDCHCRWRRDVVLRVFATCCRYVGDVSPHLVDMSPMCGDMSVHTHIYIYIHDWFHHYHWMVWHMTFVRFFLLNLRISQRALWDRQGPPRILQRHHKDTLRLPQGPPRAPPGPSKDTQIW